MSNPLPGLRGTSIQALQGFTKSVCFKTTVNTFMGGQEQRHPNTPPLYRLQMPFNSLNETDRAAYISLFAATKGRFAQNITLTLGGTTYSNLALEQDTIAFVTPSARLYNTQIALRQVQNGTWTPPTPLTSFPNLSAGVVAQYPFQDE